MTKWAFLIGVDRTFGVEDMPGCRNDVKTMSRLLQQRFGFQKQHILEMLVHQDDSTEANFGGVITERTPTYDNIITAFRGLKTLCCPGDLVYFHFSGAVIDAQSVLPEYRAFPNAYPDLAFIPADCCYRDTKRLLHDLELSALLHRLIQKGAEVIAMLDCRPSPDAFELPDSELAGPRQAHLTTEPSTPLQELKEMSFVDVRWSQRLPDSWMYDPSPAEEFSMIKTFDREGVCTGKLVRLKDGWETVYEIQDRSGTEHGMLTYWMRKALADNDKGITLRDLYHLMLEEARNNDGIKQGGNHTSLVGSGLRLFPGSMQDEEHRSLVPVPTPTRVFSELPKSCTEKVHRCSLQGITKEQREGEEPSPPAMSLAGSSTAAPGAHAQAYRHFLRFEGADQESSPYVHVEISGGYRYQDAVCAPYPDYDENGLFHALSGDHVVLLIRNLSNQELFLRIIHFGCDYSVETIYPNADLVHGFPTFRRSRGLITPFTNQNELCLHFRVGSRVFCQERSHAASHLSQCFKIFISDRPASFKCMELLPTNAAENPQLCPDPVMWALAEKETNSSDGPQRANYDFLDMAFAESKLHTGSDGEATLTSSRGAWACQNVLYAIHKAPDSLRRALRA